MITLGVDAHKKLHVATAVDETGHDLGSWRGPNTPAGWQDALTWASGLGVTRQWGIEGAWGYGRGLAQHLVATGEAVYEVNTRWTALGRRHARRPGKTDRLDARAVATFVLGEAPDLPRVGAEDVTVVLDLLTSEREALRSETRRLWNQIHALLLQLDPEYKTHLPSFESRAIFAVLEQYEPASASAVQEERAAAVRRLAQRLRLGEEQARELEREIKARTAAAGFSALTEIYGVGLVVAGTLAGILGPGCRFRTDAELAAYAGAAPLETSSAGLVRHRLNRGGNRRLNSLLYMIVLTQLRCWSPAQAYMERRLAEGKTKREAIRALKRFLVRVIWKAWKKCLSALDMVPAHKEPPLAS
jgi:transposase